jgi:hypothetical protein
MGKLVRKAKDIINDNIQGYLNQSSNDYTRLLEGSPTFVVYYNRNNKYSTEDAGLGGVKQLVGRESPSKFDRIADFALYKIDQVNLQNELNDFGPTTTIEGEAVVLPGTINPLPNDFFIIAYNGEEFLFKVTDVQPDRMQGLQYTKIQYELTTESTSSIEEQVQERMELIYDNLGAGERVVVKEEAVRLLNKANDISDSLIDFYDINFRHKTLNLFMFLNNDVSIYNEHLVKFLKDDSLLFRKSTFMSAIVMQELIAYSGYSYDVYQKSIYYAVRNKTHEKLLYENFIVDTLSSKTLPFYRVDQSFGFLRYTEDTSGSNVVIPFNNDLVTNIKENILFNEEVFSLEDTIIKYINNDLTLNEALLNSLLDYEYLDTITHFLLIPCILFILKEYKAKLLT